MSDSGGDGVGASETDAVLRAIEDSPSSRLAQDDTESMASDHLLPLAVPEQNSRAHPNDATVPAQIAQIRKQLGYTHDCKEARRFAVFVSRQVQQQQRRDFMVVTGGGPGVVEAAERGAFEAGARSIGLKIMLPHEQVPNPCVSSELCFRSGLFNPVPAARGLAKAALALVLSLPLLPALAQASADGASGVENCKAPDGIEFRGLTARLENDFFANTDRNYTNGVAFTAVSRDIAGSVRTECLPVPVRLHAELIKLLNPSFWSNAGGPAQTHNVVVKFGQSIYTPNDPLRTELIADDRPYAGLLYIGMSLNRRRHEPQSHTEILDTREVTIGIIGPWSLAKEVQNGVHDAIGTERFLGWEHQLKNEPALQLAMDRKFKDYRGAGAVTPGFSADSIRSIGLRLGNIETSAALGIEGRIGWNIPNDFGSYPIRPGAENRPPSSASIRGDANDVTRTASGPRTGVHVFGTLEGKLVAHDFSLDGNLFRSSHHVTRRPWVAQAAVGLSAQGLVAGRGVKLAVMRVYRSREFREQVSNHAYGSVALSIEY